MFTKTIWMVAAFLSLGLLIEQSLAMNTGNTFIGFNWSYILFNCFFLIEDLNNFEELSFDEKPEDKLTQQRLVTELISCFKDSLYKASPINFEQETSELTAPVALHSGSRAKRPIIFRVRDYTKPLRPESKKQKLV